MILKHETGLPALDALRDLVRYNTHGGSTWAAVFTDGGMICERCAKANYRQIYAATRDGTHTGWQVVGLANSGESENVEYCEQCHKLLWYKPCAACGH